MLDDVLRKVGAKQICTFMWWGRGGWIYGVLFFLPLKVCLKVDILLPASPDLRILVIEGDC